MEAKSFELRNLDLVAGVCPDARQGRIDPARRWPPKQARPWWRTRRPSTAASSSGVHVKRNTVNGRTASATPRMTTVCSSRWVSSLERSSWGVMRCGPLASLSEPLADLSGPTSYVELQSSLDDLAPPGKRYYWKSLFSLDSTSKRWTRWLRAPASAPVQTLWSSYAIWGRHRPCSRKRNGVFKPHGSLQREPGLHLERRGGREFPRARGGRRSHPACGPSRQLRATGRHPTETGSPVRTRVRPEPALISSVGIVRGVGPVIGSRV